MPEFEFQNGFVSIGEQELDITARPITGIKQWYRERKSTLILLTAAFLFYAVIALYDVGPARSFFAAILSGTAVLLFLWSLVYFDIVEGQPTTIPREAIKEAHYQSKDRFGWSKVTIVYVEEGGDEEQIKERDIQTSFPLLGGNNRLEPAIEALEKAGIETRRDPD